MKTIYETIVGSKMHGLDTPESDTDLRYITLAPLRDIISPFKNQNTKVKTGDEDVCSWELSHFVKQLSSGNATIYEVIKSPLFTPTPWSDAVREFMPLCYQPKKILMAHIGYARSQLDRFIQPAWHDLSQYEIRCPLSTRPFVMSTVWEKNRYRRLPKAIVASYRVLAQAEQLITTGDFQPVVADYSQKLHDKLMEIKLRSGADFTADELYEHSKALDREIGLLNDLWDSLPVKTKVMVADIEKIEDLLVEIYKKEDQ